jgi:hypothetical protein
LLLQILHRDPVRPDPARLASLTSSDWTLVAAEAIRHHLAFQLAAWIAADPDRGASTAGACLPRLDHAVRRIVIHNLRQQRSLRQLLTACEATDVPAILLKGLWQTELVYRDLGARPAGDIDLLVRPGDMPRFTRLVATLGFDLPAGVADLRDLAPGLNEFTLLRPGHAPVDVHWQLTRPIEECAVDEETLWRRSETVTLAGLPCRSLRLEDHLLYICFHAAIHHRFTQIGPRALVDVARLIAEPPRPIEWSLLTNTAKEFGWSRGVWLILDLVREHLGVEPPPAVLRALRPLGGDEMTARDAAMGAIFLHRPPSVSQNVARLLDEPSLRGRTSVLIDRLFPPRDYIARRFDTPPRTPGFHWLYVRRWLSLFRNHLPTMARMAAAPGSYDAELKQAWLDRWIAAPDPLGLATRS